MREARSLRLVPPPDFFRSGSRLGMSPSDFRCYHIAISCLGPDDFVDVVHDDFPLCENNEHDLRSRISEFSVSLHYRKSVSYGAFLCKSGRNSAKVVILMTDD